MFVVRASARSSALRRPEGRTTNGEALPAPPVTEALRLAPIPCARPFSPNPAACQAPLPLVSTRPPAPAGGCSVLDAPASLLPRRTAPRCDARSWTLPRPFFRSSRRSPFAMASRKLLLAPHFLSSRSSRFAMPSCKLRLALHPVAGERRARGGETGAPGALPCSPPYGGRPDRSPG